MKKKKMEYPCSEIKGADQLCSYCTADLHLSFRICRLLVFSCSGSDLNSYMRKKQMRYMDIMTVLPTSTVVFGFTRFYALLLSKRHLSFALACMHLMFSHVIRNRQSKHCFFLNTPVRQN